MKRTSKYFFVMILALVLILALVACGGDVDDDSKEITITISKGGDTDGIVEFFVKELGQTETMSMGGNTLTISDSVHLEVSFKLEEYYKHTLKVNDTSVTTTSVDDVAKYYFSANVDTTIDLTVTALFHNVTVKIEDNTDGLADIGVRYKGELKTGEFETNSKKSFDIKHLSTEVNGNYRFVTSVDCKAFGGYNSNSWTSYGDQSWITISLKDDENEVVTVRFDVEYKVCVDITSVPTELRTNIKIIAVDSHDVPSGIVDPLEVIEYGTIVAENNLDFVTDFSAYVKKGMMVAVVASDGEGNLSFFPHQTVDGDPVSSGLHIVNDIMEITINPV